MILEDIAVNLEDAGLGVLAQSIFVGQMPVKKTDIIAVMPQVSPVPHKTFDVYEQHIDFWVRFKSSVEGYEKLESIRDLFHRKYAYDLENTFVYFSNSMSAIDDLDRDSEGRKLYKLSLRFIYRPRS